MSPSTPSDADLQAQVTARWQSLGLPVDPVQVARLSKALARWAAPEPLPPDASARDFAAVLQQCRHG